MKIVPFEEASFSDDEVYYDEMTMKYVQNADCTEDRDEMVQEIEISCRNNGTARFVHFKTDGWSIDDPYDLVKIIQDFCKRANIELESVEQ